MRSRPYTPPPPLPPLLSELSAYLPNRRDHRPNRGDSRSSEDAVPLSELDPETSRLLPPQRKKRGKHHVRIQGKLAPVRSVSVVNLRSKSADRRGSSSLRDDTATAAAAARFDTGVGGTTAVPRRRRRSEDGGGDGDGDGDTGSDETDEEEVRERDTQLRGYGIGGAGNIRRATDVIGTSSRTSSLSLSSLFSSSSSGSTTTPSSPGLDKRWRLSGLLNRIEERRAAKDRGR
ncbi:hypothetical protein F4820DRAFT_439512 [Hypoxylon rubiginosum]|uniref:Uncharacterized protein n=1 Tax=Hypoxylon rubiginosum TaxID=110542 RepID=A0ACB9YKX3_9PEZI|nr:hypothetical protein F4820DRAFT_439512 [Hypoxylon rubiginosum]